VNRTTPLRPSEGYKGLSRTSGLSRTRQPGTVTKITGQHLAPVIKLETARRTAPRDTIPPDIRRLVTRRDLGLCVHCGLPAKHQHHRRLKGHGGDTRAHADCCCNLVSLCVAGHELAHRERFFALAEGLIVPGAARLPGLLPVLVHGYEDGSGVRVWPTCTGEWIDYEPDGGSAA